MSTVQPDSGHLYALTPAQARTNVIGSQMVDLLIKDGEYASFFSSLQSLIARLGVLYFIALFCEPWSPFCLSQSNDPRSSDFYW